MKKVFWLLVIAAFWGCESEVERRDRFFQLGNRALEDGAFQAAIRYYDEAVKADPQFAAALNNRGVAKIEDSRPYEAVLDYNQAIIQEPQYLDALFNRAYAYEEIGKYEKTLKDVATILDLRADSAFVHFYQGLVLTKMKRYEEAFQSFTVSDSLSPANPETLINMATIHYFRQDYKKAIQGAEEALSLQTDDANALNLLSLIYVEKEQYNAALVEINHALDQVPNEPYFLNNRGFIYLKMDSLDRAIEDINRSVVLNPKNGWAYRNKGIYLSKKGDWEGAVRLYTRALDTGDFIDEIYSYLGDAMWAMDKKEEACAAWGEGVKLTEALSRKRLNQNCN